VSPVSPGNRNIFIFSSWRIKVGTLILESLLR